MHHSKSSNRSNGFTLVELAIVLVIVALLTSGLMMGITAQRTSADNADAQRQLDNIREALLGYAMANGRLPCPANPALTSADLSVGTEERPNTSSPCTRTYGVIPWVTLGLPETDPWGRRFTYFASSNFSGQVPTPTGALVSFTLNTLGNANIKDSAASSANIASNVPAVVVSHGSNGLGAWQTNGAQIVGAVGDELENADIETATTQIFVSRTPSNDFDDLVTWIAPGILMAKMVAAGRLP